MSATQTDLAPPTNGERARSRTLHEGVLSMYLPLDKRTSRRAGRRKAGAPGTSAAAIQRLAVIGGGADRAAGRAKPGLSRVGVGRRS